MSKIEASINQQKIKATLKEQKIGVEVRAIGPTGAGVAPGGTTGQILAKQSDTDFDTHWIDPTAGITNLDGGTASSVYLISQVIDGGTA